MVIESVTYQLELDPVAAWSMTEAEETGQRQANAGAILIAVQTIILAVLADEDADDG